MKICLINSLYPPYSRGGAERVTENIVQGLKKRGHDVFVITVSLFKGLRSLKAEEEKRIYRFFPLNLFSFIEINKKNFFLRLFWHFFDLFNLHSARTIKHILSKEKPDLVCTHNLKGLGYLIPRAIKKLGLRHFHTLHDFQLSLPGGFLVKGEENILSNRIFLRKWYEKICSWLFNSPEIVISPSQFLLDFYDQRNFFKGSRKIVLPNPIINLGKINYSFSSKLNLLYLGQIEKHKGIFFLLDVFDKLNDSFFLHIAGQGKELEKVKERTKNNHRIKVYGFLSQEELEKVFSNIDFTLLPSPYYENAPMAVYESLSRGIPVIASKIGGVPEIIRDRENGFTFETNNKEELLNILNHCLKDKKGLDLMKQKAQESVKDYLIDNYLKELLSL